MTLCKNTDTKIRHYSNTNRTKKSWKSPWSSVYLLWSNFLVTEDNFPWRHRKFWFAFFFVILESMGDGAFCLLCDCSERYGFMWNKNTLGKNSYLFLLAVFPDPKPLQFWMDLLCGRKSKVRHYESHRSSLIGHILLT